MSWREEGKDHWRILLRRGATDQRYDAAVRDDAAKEFDAKLSYDEYVIEPAADRLHAEWRGAEVDAFAAAMEHGVITADDAGR